MEPHVIVNGKQLTFFFFKYRQNILTTKRYYKASVSPCHVVRFLLVIVLSVLLRFMASDYRFGIFKLFLNVYTAAYLYYVIASVVGVRIILIALSTVG
jgi:hypothetical protein